MSNTIKIGNLEIDSFKVGAADCSIYLGTTKLYPQGEPPTPPVFEGKYKLTLSDSSVISGECDGTPVIYRSDLSAYSQTCVSAEVGDCVTALRSSFINFHNLSSITISSGVTEISGAFEECSGLTSIELPNNVTYIGSESFKYCTNLTGITIPDGVRSVSYAAFSNCYGINEIIIPDSVETIEPYAFVNCTGATNCTIGKGVTSIGYLAFNGCSNLNSITINALTPPGIGNGVFDNTNDCPIYVDCSVVEDFKQASGWASYSSRITCIQQ
jgi:hypothetical protein